MKLWHLMLLFVCTLIGCPHSGSPPITATGDPPQDRPLQPIKRDTTPLTVGVIVEALGKEGLRVVQPGEILCSFEQLLLRVEVSREAFVYVVYGKQGAQQDEIQVLFPPQGDLVLRPEGFQRVPPVGQWLMLDDKVGHESLFVAASESPIESARLSSLVSEALRHAPIPPPNPKRSCPGPRGLGNSNRIKPTGCASKCAPADWRCLAECDAIARGDRPANYSRKQEEDYLTGNLVRFKGIMLTNDRDHGQQLGQVRLIRYPFVHK